MITLLQERVASAKILGIEKLNFFVFGSALWKHDPDDIDVVIVYDSVETNICEVLDIRRHLKEIIGPRLGKELDICTLSTDEAEQTQFIEEEEAIRLPVA